MKSDSFCIKYTRRDESWLDGTDVAVPLEITFSCGTANIEYYPAAEDIVSEFVKLYGAEERTMLSSSAMQWLNGKFDEFLGKYGFSISPDSAEYYICYRLEPRCLDMPDCVMKLSSVSEYNDLTDTDIEGLINGGYIIYAAIVDGNIAALANTGVPIAEHSPEEIEIGVDTAQAYRKRGLGKACVASLTNELYRMGHTVTYECASRNIASVKLAESVGGEVSAKKIYIVGFAD